MINAPLTQWKYGESMDAWLYPHVREKLEELIVAHDIRTVLEIGTCYGCSAVWFAQHRQISSVTCIDTWGDIPEHGMIGTFADFKQNIQLAGVGHKVNWICGDSHKEMTKLIAMDEFDGGDLIYLDGDHTYEGVKQDIADYSPMARKVLCGDDYDEGLPSVAGVIRAVDECVPDRKTMGRFWWISKEGQ